MLGSDAVVAVETPSAKTVQLLPAFTLNSTM
jgi:hypothetical protein